MISLRQTSGALLASALILTAACGDDASTSPPLRPATAVLLSPATVTTAPGLPISEPVRVRLITSNQTVVPNHLVHFTITGGSGAHLSRDSAFTDENGDVSVDVVTGAAGVYTVTVTPEGVTPVSVTVNAVAPVADAIFVYSGNNQGGFAGEPISQFTAIVLNELGVPQPGVTVNFAVASGGGSVSPTSAVTDANGLARTTLTLGTGAVQTVTATAAGLSASASTNTSTTFTATVANPCTASRSIGNPATVNRALDALDCKNAQSRYLEYHRFTTTGTLSSTLVTMTSTAFTPALSLSSAGGADTLAIEPTATTSASYRVFAPAGTYWLRASSTTNDATGAFTLSTATSNTNNDNCPATPIYVVPGSIINGNIAATDCVFSGDATQHADQYYVYLRQGQQLRINLASVPQAASSIDMWIRVRNMTTGAFNNTDCCSGATIESRLHTAATTGVYRIEAGVYYDPAAPTPQTGSYRLEILNP